MPCKHPGNGFPKPSAPSKTAFPAASAPQVGPDLKKTFFTAQLANLFFSPLEPLRLTLTHRTAKLHSTEACPISRIKTKRP